MIRDYEAQPVARGRFSEKAERIAVADSRSDRGPTVFQLVAITR